MKINLKDCFLACAISVAMYYIVIALVGIAAAIATPDGYFEWFKEQGATKFGFYLWNAVTIIPAQVIPAIVITYIAARYFAKSIMFFCAMLLLIYVTFFVIEYRTFGSWLIGLVYPISIVLASYLALRVKNKKKATD